MTGMNAQRGFTPEQFVELNTHRNEGRKVHVSRDITFTDVAAITLASVIAVCASMLAWHIFSVAMGG